MIASSAACQAPRRSSVSPHPQPTYCLEAWLLFSPSQHSQDALLGCGETVGKMPGPGALCTSLTVLTLPTSFHSYLCLVLSTVCPFMPDNIFPSSAPSKSSYVVHIYTSTSYSWGFDSNRSKGSRLNVSSEHASTYIVTIHL